MTGRDFLTRSTDSLPVFDSLSDEFFPLFPKFKKDDAPENEGKIVLFEREIDIQGSPLALCEIKRKADPKGKYEAELQPLYDWVMCHDEVIQRQALYILSKKNLLPLLAEGKTVLHLAVLKNLPELVEVLLSSKQVGVNTRTLKEGRTALHFAVALKFEKIVRILLGVSEIDVNIQTMRGSTALHLAVEKGRMDFVYHLLSLRADVNIKRGGDTPLDLAIREDKINMIWVLIGAGATLDDEKYIPSDFSVDDRDPNNVNHIIQCVKAFEAMKMHKTPLSSSQAFMNDLNNLAATSNKVEI